jgi:O-antigen ligase
MRATGEPVESCERNSRYGTLAVVLLLGSLWIHGLGDILRLGLIAPWTVALPASICLLLLDWGGGRPFMSPAGSRLGAGISLAGLTVLGLLSAFGSMDGAYGLAVVIAMASELALFLLLSSLVWTPAELTRLNRLVHSVGVIACALSVLAFLAVMPRLPAIVATPAAWSPRFGYVLDRGSTLRLVGLVGDPNFFALFSALPLMIGIGLRGRWRWLGTALISFAVLLTFSRSFAAALFVVLISYGVAISLRSRTGLRRALLGAAVGAALTVGVLQVEPLRETIEYRIERVGAESRFNIWRMLSFSEETLLRGEGIGAARERLGFYSHNTFIDFAFDTGLFGLLSFLSFVAFVSAAGVSNARGSPELRPWLLGWFVLVLMLNTFSLGFNPLVVSWAGVLCSPVTRQNSDLA